MDRLEVHSLICKRDINWFISTVKLFKYYSKLDFDVVIHEDGSFNTDDINYLLDSFSNIKIITRNQADEQVMDFLKDYELSISNFIDQENVIDEIIRHDGYTAISTYDGKVGEEDVEGTTYYIVRVD